MARWKLKSSQSSRPEKGSKPVNFKAYAESVYMETCGLWPNFLWLCDKVEPGNGYLEDMAWKGRCEEMET